MALLNRRDQHHAWTRRTLAQARVPALTVDAVISEVLFLLRRNGLSADGLFELLESGALAIEPAAEGDLSRLVGLCRKYSDVPMSWADGSLVLLSEKKRSAKLLTFDSDFAVYRRFGRERLPLVQPLSRTKQR